MPIHDPWLAQAKNEGGSGVFDTAITSSPVEPVEYLELRCSEKDLRHILRITRQERRQFFQDLRFQCRDALRRMKQNDVR